MNQNHFEYVVIGGGIAGLAIAEIFARSGGKVLLIEKNAKICQEASAAQHGWFHFGSLYSIFPQSHFLKALLLGVEDLLAYYSGFSGMNAEIVDDGKLVFLEKDNAWFRNERINYIVSARNNQDFGLKSFSGVIDYIKKIAMVIGWEAAIKQFISRHQRFENHNWSSGVTASEWIPRAGFGDYSKSVIQKPSNPNINLDINTHFAIQGYDRPMNSSKIVEDLAKSYLAAGGQILVNAEVDHVGSLCQGFRAINLKDGRVFYADTVISSAGRWSKQFLNSKNEVKVVASPLLVVYPKLTNQNFVRMSPYIKKTINHICHSIDGHDYSLVGGGYYASPNRQEELIEAVEGLNHMAKIVFPDIINRQYVDSYMGYKTEIVSKFGERDYQYKISEIDQGYYAVIPGKFSLAFALAVNLYKKVKRKDPEKMCIEHQGNDAEKYIDTTKHGQLVRNYLDKKNH